MAMAPERIGIGLRRHFTTPGVHPYDEVTWERRDARITNFRDGSIAFEQREVEVPTFWSQNATNILAQKYFRGQLGTAERETSLKQVADRVADTIADWGVKDGYFVDDAEADAFRDELKYLIIHQRAAFNSPVWFNVGVKGVPQQASACQPWDALVSTPDGLVPIGRLVDENAVGAKVYDATGITRVVAVKANGIKPVLRIRTKAGHQLDVTGDHLVWQASDARCGAFVPASELRPGDRLSWHGEDGTKSVEIEGVQDLGNLPVYDIQTESGEYLSGNLRVHNCFILAVEDQMDAILDWYKEEGTIFKGGSGSGINLSRIRSSKEHLKGGGTASGPVSFMRGADASAGTIKCLEAATEIVTEEGVKAIAEVKAGDRVLTRHGLRPVVAVHDNGVRPLLRVQTAFGDSIRCTPEHRWWVRRADGEGWVEAADLRAGDAICLDLSAGLGTGAMQAMTGVDDGHFNEHVHELPPVLDERFAMWLGWLWGDGSITDRPGAKFIAMQIGDADPDLEERYRELSQAIFGSHAHLWSSRHLDKTDRSASVRLSSSLIIRYLAANGLHKGKAPELRVPKVVADSPATVRAAFLSGLFEADGHVQNGYPMLSTASERLAVDVHRLLTSIGIPSIIKRIDGRSQALGDLPVHTVRVVGCEGVRRFAKLVGFVSERKHAAMYRAVVRKDASPFEQTWSLPHCGAELQRVWDAGDARLRRAVGPYVRHERPRAMSLLRARALVEMFPDAFAGTAIERFAMGNEVWVPVATIPDGEGETYDLTVEEVHEYMVAGLVTHNSGGKTRRAAKMVILNADHPDIEDFIWCKAIEERKARALRDAGFDMDLDGKDSHSIQYQNANNSVRVTDEFMQAVLDNAEWNMRAVTTGEVLETVKARDLFRQIAKAAWECADPGLQFDTTINRWHTAANTGPITASNPCFTGDALVHTDKGLVAFRELVGRVNAGESFLVYTHDATNPEAPAEAIELTSPEALMITGYNPVVRLRFDSGLELRCTPSHKIFTVNRGYVAASELTPEDRVKALDLPTPAVDADIALPVPTSPEAYRQVGDHKGELVFPEEWDHEFAHYLGWIVGDGSTSGSTVSAIYGSAEDRTFVLPRHQDLIEAINGSRPIKPSEQANGTVQLRLGRRRFKAFLEALGVKPVKGPEKAVPWSIQQAPPLAVAGFLQGLFDADGCARHDAAKGSYVGLGSASRQLLVDTQRLLSTFGVTSRIYSASRGGASAFTYTRKDGTTTRYQRSPSWDLRISSGSLRQFASQIGFSLPSKSESLAAILEHETYAVDTSVKLVERSDEGSELTYNLSEPRNHSYVVNGVVVRNCSEYVHLDNSACNLASINLLRFLRDDDSFDVEAYRAAIEVVFTAQEILVGNADYPTEKIAATTRRFRQLGLGYANLGALLMALGLPYDSDEGRAYAAALTAMLTGHAYATSARTAMRMGPFAGYSENKEHMDRVLRMHRDEVAHIDEELVPTDLLSAAQEAWDTAVELGEVHGVRNSQATVLAPTGCLVGGSLVATSRGLVRLRSLGDVDGAQWQDLGVSVQTDDGPKPATKFYVNGSEPVVDVRTERGHGIRGTAQHRVKVVDTLTGEWQWRRMADLCPGDLVPLAMDQLIGDPQHVPLPPLPDAYWTSDHTTYMPRTMTADLAELVGYFMGDGSLHSRGLRFCVSEQDGDVVDRLLILGKECFGLAGHVAAKRGYTEVRFDSVRLVLWWEACGFAKRPPSPGQTGKSDVAHIPDAVLHANDRRVYAAFLRGLFEADGTVTVGYPHWMTTSLELADDVQSLLLAMGFPTTKSIERKRTGWGPLALAKVRLLNLSSNDRWLAEVGFMGARKDAKVIRGSALKQAAGMDHIPLTRALIDRLCPENGRLRRVLLMEQARGTVSRRIVTELYEQTGDAELGRLLGYFFDRVATAELGDDELTYDLSVPENVTYVANGFISHNTISFLLDCDTTGIEPDLGLVKSKKLVGGGNMKIVNQTVPRALRRLAYTDGQIEEIIAYIDEHDSIVGAPHITEEHLAVFACSMGDNTIHYTGHVRMMGAVQPFISGAISKTVNMPEEATVEEVEQLHVDAWKLGLKAVAIYRDNCKVAQPLSTARRDEPTSEAEAHDAELAAKVAELEQALQRQTVVVKQPLRERLPRKRRSNTFSFRVADCEGYVTVGEYDDGRPGEVFIKVSKQGSTLAGVMDAFSIAISVSLQHGVPLATYVKKYTNMRFEPAGMTDDPDLRIASSLVDYIFRRLAVDYLPFDERAELGILTTGERMQPTLPGIEESTTPNAGIVETPALPEAVRERVVEDQASPEAPSAKDAPYCYQCGNAMQRAGSCFVCTSCGTTSGCS